jgi:hypothetical protein
VGVESEDISRFLGLSHGYFDLVGIIMGLKCGGGGIENLRELGRIVTTYVFV